MWTVGHSLDLPEWQEVAFIPIVVSRITWATWATRATKSTKTSRATRATRATKTTRATRASKTTRTTRATRAHRRPQPRITSRPHQPASSFTFFVRPTQTIGSRSGGMRPCSPSRIPGICPRYCTFRKTLELRGLMDSIQFRFCRFQSSHHLHATIYSSTVESHRFPMCLSCGFPPPRREDSLP